MSAPDNLPGRAPGTFRFQPGQTVLFLGDHTAPGEEGFVRVVRDVLARFYPALNLNLISAGSSGQTARGLNSQALMDILLSSHPGWVAINIGLGDVLREPELQARLDEYTRHKAEAEDDFSSTLGPEHRVDPTSLGPVSDVGKELPASLKRLDSFTESLQEAVKKLQRGGVEPILFTSIVLGSDSLNPINLALRQYNRAIREVAAEHNSPLVEIERPFHDLIDRAANYKQVVSLTTPNGKVNAQGEALLARNFLGTFGVLPAPGFRPSL